MELLKHECGVAAIRLLRPLTYFQEKYGTWMYGLNKLYLMMEKQHNRGQEGAGIACVKQEAQPGCEYMFRERAVGSGAIEEIFSAVNHRLAEYGEEELTDAAGAARNLPFAGEIYMGHLRYSTTGRRGLAYVHPFLRRNNWRARNLCICGNFNMTNVEEIFRTIEEKGQHPRMLSDTYLLLEQLGHRLDRESERLFEEAKEMGLKDSAITRYIEEHINPANVLRQAASVWDGGYVLCGVTGSGEFFAMRDPWGIRPAFWYADDEVMALASERPVLQTSMNVPIGSVRELGPGEALLVSAAGRIRTEQILPRRNVAPCSFERVYFSRGSDRDIYRERKSLGRRLVEPVLRAVDYDLEHTVVSYIPNTAEAAYFGLVEGLNDYLNELKLQQIKQLGGASDDAVLRRILSTRVRAEKVAWKDIKMRTFIAEGHSRKDLAAHVYDVTYGSLNEGEDNLVVIDDSIVRGTTLRESIVRIMDRLGPRRIVVVSSSPQVRYPDYYGIDMARMDEFIAFKAAVALRLERGEAHVLRDVYDRCKAQAGRPKEEVVNVVTDVYAGLSAEDISAKTAELLRPEGVTTDIRIVYQTLEGLHEACPNHPGDWYFSGRYPTPGGVARVLAAYADYYEKNLIKQTGN